MGFTTFMALLRFALFCVDLLAWPAIALGYPLVASIRAVESGSKDHMKKLVVYWTLFSLFSLFEYAFVKIIEWIPFWSSARLVVIFWLVIPEFDGAYDAYVGLVRPVLLVKAQAVIDRFYKLKEERMFYAIEKYVEENGPEAMEKLIALEHENQLCNNSQGNTKTLESDGENAASMSRQLHEPNPARRNTEMLEASEKSSATMTPQVQIEQSVSSASVLNRSDVATDVNHMTLPEASAENKCSKHKFKLESLKASMLHAKDTRPSLLVQTVPLVSADWDLKGTYAAVDAKEIMTPKESAENRPQETTPYKKAQQKWTLKATESKMELKVSHQASKPGALKASKRGAKDAGPSQGTWCKLNHGNVAEKFIEESGSVLEALSTDKDEHKGCNNPHREIQSVASEEKNCSAASPKVQYARPGKAVWVPRGTDAEVKMLTPPLKKPQQESTCDSYEVSEKRLNAHHQGSTARSKFQSLKTSKANQGDVVVTENRYGEKSMNTSLNAQIYKYQCTVCDVKLISDIDLASHLQGRRHSSNILHL